MRLIDRSWIAVAALALGACSQGTSERDVEPHLARRAIAGASIGHSFTEPRATVEPARSAAAAPSTSEKAATVENIAPTPDAQPVASARPAVAEPALAADVINAGDEQDRATQVLRRVESAAAGVRTLQADFTQRLHVALLGQDQQSSGRLYQKRPDRFLMRFTSPAGDVMVADGRSFWIYYPSTDRKQVIRTTLAKGAGQVDLQRQFLGNASARFSAVLGADESVGGRPAYVLTLTPRGASQFRRLKVWADKGDYLVRRFEVTEQNESVRRIELRNLRVNAPVPDALFRFTPPAGTQVFDQ
jgi:outer membrane lipoprotein carrier protein